MIVCVCDGIKYTYRVRGPRIYLLGNSFFRKVTTIRTGLVRFSAKVMSVKVQFASGHLVVEIDQKSVTFLVDMHISLKVNSARFHIAIYVHMYVIGIKRVTKCSLHLSMYRFFYSMYSYVFC